MSAAPSSSADFEAMFDLAPVSLWLEDFSAVRALLQRWRAQGVTDLRAFLREDPERVSEYGRAIRVLKVNQRSLALFGAPDQQTLVDSLHQVFRDDMLENVLDEISQLWEGALEFANQTVNYALDGRRLDVHIRGRILPGHESSWDRVLISLEDNTREQQARRLLQDSERQARLLFEHSPVSLWVEDFSAVKRLLDQIRERGIVDLKTFLKVHPEFIDQCMREIRVIDVNRTTLAMFGAPSRQALLAGLHKIFQGEMLDSFGEQLIDLWEGRLLQQREVVNYTLAGTPLSIHMQFVVQEDHRDDWSLVLLSLVDITARKKAEAYLEYLGKHDVLTGLRNRAYYIEELNRLTRKGPWPVAVIAVDLNGLKHVNDEQGHAAGDAVLRRAGEVLAKALDTLPGCAARIGGDEFCVLLPDADERAAQALMERLTSLQELNNQYYPGQPLHFAMGVAVAREGESLETVTHRADRAMYAAKQRYYEAAGADRRRD
ncbi:GGDEF domain-containing protein [Comamonas sp. NLF-1-9]|uniref:sensor domain-containing diguanylate cyclase n=1 Tax=Comamonas sp. NLF-1-9 TaxID=2853163 RepID=UPI001C47467B|nr:GGDEF domain-containing protein [Comamonas sp. NLF-1-9]QXL84468.1 sensor domain-containing diguanylate cyclase [Comamonas sp. NLF-1-9]